MTVRIGVLFQELRKIQAFFTYLTVRLGDGICCVDCSPFITLKNKT